MKSVAILYANFNPKSELSFNARVFYEHLESYSTKIPYDLFWVDSSPQIPEPIKNWKPIKKIFHDSQNLGRDFGMWGRALAQIDLSQYEYVLFLNKSCQGPMQNNWIENFIDQFKKYPKAALVAPLANFAGGWHLQTWAFMITVTDLKDLLQNDARAFGNKMKFAPYWVFDSRELLISQYFLKKGRSIVSLLKNYPEIFLETNPGNYPVIIRSDPNFGIFREGFSGNLSLRQQLVFMKNTPGK